MIQKILNMSTSKKLFIVLLLTAFLPAFSLFILIFLFFSSKVSLLCNYSDFILFISIFLFICLIISASFSFIINKLILFPIKNLSDLVRKTKDGEVKKTIEKAKVKNREINELYSLFNEFIISTELKKEHEKQIELQKKELENLNIELQKENAEKRKSEEKIQEMMLDLAEFAKTLEEKVEQSVNELREKDALLIKQSGLAAMGEMIGNIAHQWRQPINAVGLIIQNIQEAYEYDDLTEEYLNQNVTKAMDIIQFMSQTINDFRNFFKPEKEKQDFNISQSVLKSVTLIEAGFKSNNININVVSNEELSTFGYPNEYSQVILNILNNARDVLIERKVENPQVFICMSKSSQGKAVLTIEDNAGGIPENIIDKIFDPYFTTKDQGKGTGLGLYMSKTIIEKNMDGTLKVCNGEFGAKFTIET